MTRLSDEERIRFCVQLENKGLTPDMLRAVNRHADMASPMIEALKQHPRLALIHGVFTPQDRVLRSFQARCAEQGVDFDKFSWIGSDQAPEFNLNDPKSVIVLDAALGRFQESYTFALAWCPDARGDNPRRWSGVDLSISGLGGKKRKLFGPIVEPTPWTLRWTRIRLDSKDIIDDLIRACIETTPNCTLLFLAAQHPAAITDEDFRRNDDREHALTLAFGFDD